jgi:hypothetical protein
VFGTPRYMSPEQCKNARTVDGRSDVYSLGCILYEMLVGVAPFDYDNWGELVAAHIHEPTPRPRTRVPEISFEVEQIVMRAVEKDPGERYQTMAELAKAIDTLWPGRASLVFTPIPGALKTMSDAQVIESATPTLRTRSTPSSGRWVAVFAGIAVLGGVTAVVVAKQTSDEPKQSASIAPAVEPVKARVVVDAAPAVVAIDAAPARTKVRLVVKSIPQGAQVMRSDGVTLGITPLSLELDKIDGELPLVVRHAGFKDSAIKLATKQDGEQLVKLQRAPKVTTVRRGSAAAAPAGSAGTTILDPYKK